MLTQVAEGVLVHQSELLRNNAVVVQGRAGVLLIDPGITGDEMADLANDLRELGQPVVAGFSTHPDWDHVLWHAEPRQRAPLRHGPLRGVHAGSAVERGLEGPSRRGVTAGNRRGDTARPVRPHYGPACRYRAHPWMALKSGSSSIWRAQGHAALLIEERGVLVAGDMLSDVLIPMLD